MATVGVNNSITTPTPPFLLYRTGMKLVTDVTRDVTLMSPGCITSSGLSGWGCGIRRKLRVNKNASNAKRARPAYIIHPDNPHPPPTTTKVFSVGTDTVVGPSERTQNFVLYFLGLMQSRFKYMQFLHLSELTVCNV